MRASILSASLAFLVVSMSAVGCAGGDDASNGAPPDAATASGDGGGGGGGGGGSDAGPVAGLAIVRAGTKTTEAGGTATFTVALTSAPTADVTITLTSSAPGEGTVAPASLTFTAASFASPQTVTVTGVDDALDDGDVDYEIALAVTSADAAYAALAPSPLPFTNEDDETPGFLVSAISGSTTEAGGTATFTVRLKTKPAADVSVALASDTPAEGTAAPASLVFTAADWDQAQTVTVTGVDDPDDDGDKPYAIVFEPATSTDASYQAVVAPSVAVTNVDDDTAGIVVGTISGKTAEWGKTAAFTVVLATRPAADVTVAFATNDPTEGVTDVTSLVFTAADWDTPQYVTVTGQDDTAVDGDVAYGIAFTQTTSADANYQGKVPATVAVTNVDDDTACQATCGWSGDSFEDGDFDGWTSNGKPLSVAAGGADGSAMHFEVTGGTLGHLDGAVYATTACTPSRVTVWVNPSAGSVAHNYIVLGDDSVTANNSIAFIYAQGSSGMWRAVSNTTSDFTPIVPDVWSRFDIDLDWVNKTVDIDVDGVRKVTDLPFRSSSQASFSRLHLYNFGNAVGRWDQIRVECP